MTPTEKLARQNAPEIFAFFDQLKSVGMKPRFLKLEGVPGVPDYVSPKILEMRQAYRDGKLFLVNPMKWVPIEGSKNLKPVKQTQNEVRVSRTKYK